MAGGLGDGRRPFRSERPEMRRIISAYPSTKNHLIFKYELEILTA